MSFGLVLLAVLLHSGCHKSPTAPTPPPPPEPPPALSLVCPVPVNAVSLDGNPAPVAFDAPAAQGGVSPFEIACDPQSGNAFSIGATEVSCTAKDSKGQSATCGFVVTVTVAPRIKVTRLLAFGDSLTEGVISLPLPVPSLGLTDSYPYRLEARLNERYVAQHVAVVNAGKGGESATTGASRLPGVLAQEHPEVLLLLEGSNDLNLPLPVDTKVMAATYALEEMVKEARRRGITVLLATIPPFRNGGPKSLDATVPPLLNAEIRKLAAAKGAQLVDLYAAMIGEVDTLIGQDGLHPTDAGYERITEVFYRAIVETFDVPVTTAARRQPAP